MQIRYAQPLDAQGPDPTPAQDTLTPLPMPAPSTPSSTNGVIAPAPSVPGFGDMMPARPMDRQLPGWPQPQPWLQQQQSPFGQLPGMPQEWPLSQQQAAPQQQPQMQPARYGGQVGGQSNQNIQGLMQWLSRIFGQFGQG